MPSAGRRRHGAGPWVLARRAVAVVATAAVGAGALVACGPGPVSDLSMTIGTLLPLTAREDGATTRGDGFAAQAGVALAVADINAANAGMQIDVDYQDSADWQTAAPVLFEEGVSAIIGPLDYGTAQEIVTNEAAEGQLVISPGDDTLNSLDWAKVADYFRTAPPQTAQGAALARVMRADGRESLIIVSRDNLNGPTLGESIRAAFDDDGGTTVNLVTYDDETASTSINAPVDAALSEKTDAVVYIGDEPTAQLALISVTAGYPADQLYLPERSFDAVPGDAAYAGMKAVAPTTTVGRAFVRQLKQTHRELAPGSGRMRGTTASAAQAYDAVVVTALAAMQARSTEPDAIAGKIREVTGGTEVEGAETCTTFADCAQLLRAGTPIDYDGLSGPLDIAEDGAPTTAPMSVWQYTENGSKRRVAATVDEYVERTSGG